MAKFCRECGAALRDGAKFCLKCGKAVEQQAQMHSTCAYCGAQLKPTSKFCLKCGKPVATQAPQTVASIAQPARQMAQPFANQATQPIQQATRNVATQAAQPIQHVMGSINSMANGVKAMPSAGEIAFDIPSISSASSVASGGLPSFVVPLITGTALGGISIPLLYQLPSPWPTIVGVIVATLIASVSILMKKLKRGAQR